MKCKIILLLVALAATHPASARNIVTVANVTIGELNYGSVLLDLDELKSDAGKHEFQSYIFTRNGQEYVRGVNDVEVDCSKGILRYNKRIVYSDIHTIIGESDKITRWHKVKRSSPEARMLHLICGTEQPSEADVLGNVDPLVLSDPLLKDPKFR